MRRRTHIRRQKPEEAARKKELSAWISQLLQPGLTTGVLADLIEDGSDLLGFDDLFAVDSFVDLLRGYPEETTVWNAPSVDNRVADTLLFEMDNIISAIRRCVDWHLQGEEEECLDFQRVAEAARGLRTKYRLTRAGLTSSRELEHGKVEGVEMCLVHALPASLFLEFCERGGLERMRQCPQCGRVFAPARKDALVCSTSCRILKFRSAEMLS